MFLTGYGMFTIPHGPVRSGVMESIEYLVETPGEAIPQLKLRVSYKHRGIEQRYEGMAVADGMLLAERTEGVASVAHALAYCHALEAIAGRPGPRAWSDDARLARPYDAYPLGLAPGRAHAAGDALTRLRVRWEEVDQSFGLLRRAADDLSAERATDQLLVPCAPADGRAAGWAEAPQGEVLYDVALLEGRIGRCHPRSASFHNLARRSCSTPTGWSNGATCRWTRGSTPPWPCSPGTARNIPIRWPIRSCPA